jgi:hypothetical protein
MPLFGEWPQEDAVGIDDDDVVRSDPRVSEPMVDGKGFVVGDVGVLHELGVLWADPRIYFGYQMVLCGAREEACVVALLARFLEEVLVVPHLPFKISRGLYAKDRVEG